MPASSSIDSPFAQLTADDLSAIKALIEQVLTQALESGDFVMPEAPENPILHLSGACFVSYYVDGQLRGCTGSIEAHSALWQDIAKRAYTTLKDRRFEPIRLSELKDIRFDINILTPLMAMENRGLEALLEDLSPHQDGLLIVGRNRQAVFLPTVWDALPTPEAFVRALLNKGGWPEDYWSDKLSLYRFYTFEYALV